MGRDHQGRARRLRPGGASRSSTAAQLASSSAEVGSSARIRAGRLTTARAIARRWRSPWLSWRGRARARRARPSSLQQALDALRRRGWRASERARRRLSRTLSAPIRCMLCSTMPIRRPRKASSAAGPSAARSWPSTAILPRLGRIRPAIRCKSVLLPQPDGPITRLWAPPLDPPCRQIEHRARAEDLDQTLHLHGRSLDQPGWCRVVDRGGGGRGRHALLSGASLGLRRRPVAQTVALVVIWRQSIGQPRRRPCSWPDG